MNDKRQWRIQVARKADVVADFVVPMYRLDGVNLRNFLRAVVINMRTDGPAEMCEYFFNRRAGNPRPPDDAEVTNYFDHETRRCGYWCGTWEAYATATYEVSQKEADGIRRIQMQNMGVKLRG
jgi:hypothetical protein